MKWIIFDGWGVIYTVRDNVGELLTPFVQGQNPAASYEMVRDAYMQAIVGEISPRTFWARVGLGGRYPEIERELLDSQDILDGQFVPAAEELSRLSRLGLISNDISDWSKHLRQRYGIDRLLWVCVISDAVRRRKPDRGIFEAFLGKITAPAGQCLFVDDRLENLRGAAAAGLRTCWFDRDGLVDDDFEPDLHVHSFEELPEAVENFGV